MSDKLLLTNALRALLSIGDVAPNQTVKNSIKELRKRLKQPELPKKQFTEKEREAFILGYQRAALKKKEWAGLTDEDLEKLIPETDLSGDYGYNEVLRTVLKAEAKLKEKNCG